MEAQGNPLTSPRAATPSRGVHPAEAVFRSVSEAFSNYRGNGSGGYWERRFALANRGVRLASNSEALLKTLHAPFSHLHECAEAGGPHELNVEVVTGPPRGPLLYSTGWDGIAKAAHGAADRFQASEDGRFACQEFLASGSLWCMDRVTRKIVAWVDSADRLTVYEKGKPFARHMAMWLEGSGLLRIHAGLACWRGQGVLFVGPGGSGKSTSALCCLFGGFTFLGDDFVALEECVDGSFVGHSLYNSSWLAPEHFPRFASLRGRASSGAGTERGKSMVILSELLPERMGVSAPIRYLLLPHVCPGGETAVAPVKKSEALRRLVPSCLMSAEGGSRGGFETLVRLAHQADCHRLILGQDLEAVSREVRAVVERG